MELKFSSEFKSNRLFFLAKSENSWHGLSPVRAPANIPRRSFNFFLAVPRGLFSELDIKFGEKQIKTFETKKFYGLRLQREMKRRIASMLFQRR